MISRGNSRGHSIDWVVAAAAAAFQGLALASEFALFIFALDHRIAFVALVALIVGGAIPLAFAWARILPEDRPPFEIEPPSYPNVEIEPPPATPASAKRNLVAILLLIALTVAYVFQFPGFPRDAIFRWLVSIFSSDPAPWISLVAEALAVVTAIGAVVYAILRPGRLRTPLISAAVLVAMLWILAAFLRTALLAG
jgi:hypothetical protein